jgi:hypothetical protein
MYRLDILALALLFSSSDCFLLPHRSNAESSLVQVRMTPPKGPAGSFFHPVPEEGDDDSDDSPVGIDEAITDLIKQRKSAPRASRPSTINGVPTAQAGTGV